MKSRKLGRFVLSHGVIEQAPEDVMRLMGRMIVVRAESRYDMDGVEYTAISDYFSCVPAGSIVPEYRFAFSGGDIIPEKIN